MRVPDPRMDVGVEIKIINPKGIDEDRSNKWDGESKILPKFDPLSSLASRGMHKID